MIDKASVSSPDRHVFIRHSWLRWRGLFLPSFVRQKAIYSRLLQTTSWILDGCPKGDTTAAGPSRECHLFTSSINELCCAVFLPGDRCRCVRWGGGLVVGALDTVVLRMSDQGSDLHRDRCDREE